MGLPKNDFYFLNSIIDKEIMPNVRQKPNRNYNIGHVKKCLCNISPIAEGFPLVLLAALLRQRGITECVTDKGKSYFAIDDKFFEEWLHA